MPHMHTERHKHAHKQPHTHTCTCTCACMHKHTTHQAEMACYLFQFSEQLKGSSRALYLPLNFIARQICDYGHTLKRLCVCVCVCVCVSLWMIIWPNCIEKAWWLLSITVRELKCVCAMYLFMCVWGGVVCVCVVRSGRGKHYWLGFALVCKFSVCLDTLAYKTYHMDVNKHTFTHTAIEVDTKMMMLIQCKCISSL